MAISDLTPASTDATGIYRVRDASVLTEPCVSDNLKFEQRTIRDKERWLFEASHRGGTGVEMLFRRMTSVQRQAYMAARVAADKKISAKTRDEHGDTIISFTFI